MVIWEQEKDAIYLCWADVPNALYACNEKGHWAETLGLCPKHYEEIIGAEGS